MHGFVAAFRFQLPPPRRAPSLAQGVIYLQRDGCERAVKKYSFKPPGLLPGTGVNSVGREWARKSFRDHKYYQLGPATPAEKTPSSPGLPVFLLPVFRSCGGAQRPEGARVPWPGRP
ncbi:hypothetical protein AAFF_G00417830 [Aldrovandia affinis]|uniref:Uncharacterized protein n=1 Tax=Aldrovandia affinis TaxID=143900 RepID=A0AAD7SAC3_9TELE|nr:hypothetical protein AAFF_G00417830 [Aldrovandia affinis]